MDAMEVIVIVTGLITLYYVLRPEAPEPDRNPNFRNALHHVFPDALVVLIHGTFARKASWIKAESRIARQLRNRLNGDVNVVPFYWSGENSDSARLVACLQLREMIDKVRGDAVYPVILIGHSHGGNIALNTAKHLVDETHLVTIATPFFHRELDPPSRLRRYGTYKYLPIFAIVSVLGLIALGFNPWITIISVTLSYGVGTFVLPISRDSAEAIAHFQAEGFWSRDGQSDRTLILRTAGDEATLVIAAMSIVSWLTESVHRLVFHLFDKLEIFARQASGSIVMTVRRCLIPVGTMVFGAVIFATYSLWPDLPPVSRTT